MPLTLEVAERMVRVARSKAVEMGCNVSIAVVDSGGYLLTLSRMEAAVPITAKAAEEMAFTAAMFKTAGKNILPYANRPWFQSLVTLTEGKVMPADGELPIEIGGEVVGGIAAAGGTADQDLQCCEAAVEALKNNFR
ncbi:MAG: heme-binding protein [Dehalococcoidia bacterium]